MTKQPKRLLKITATLLNSWSYQYLCDEEYAEGAEQDFLAYLNRIPVEPNIWMKRGIEFEEKCVNGGYAPISNIIKDGAFQVYVEKDIVVDGYDVRMLGYIDVLKGGKIYDIKRVNKYELQKYYNSYQHHLYLEMTPEAEDFTYLVAQGQNDDYIELYKETYTQEEKIDLIPVIRTFFNWLKERNLFDVYVKNFTVEG